MFLAREAMVTSLTSSITIRKRFTAAGELVDRCGFE
jgi:hypothetical protein